MTANNTDFFYIESDKVFLKAQGQFPEREIGSIKSSEEETIQYFMDRYKKLSQKVAEVKKHIEEQDNKGSFFQKVLNLQEELKSYDGIGDFVILSDELNNLQLMLEDYIKQNRKRNLEVKQTLIAEAKSYAANPNWKEATEQLKELRQRWMKVGAVEKENAETIEGDFQAVYDDFYNRKKVFHDARMAMMNSRIKQYTDLTDKAEKINKDSKLEEAVKTDKINDLVNQWKALENIPKEKYDELLKTFKKHTTLKGKKTPSKNIKAKSNKAAEADKKQLVEQLKVAKDLAPAEAVEAAKQIQQDWKNASKVAMPKAVNEEFFFLMDYIFERNFLETLYNKKAKEVKDAKAGLKAKMNILRDLISRDEKELLIFEENMGKFNLDNANFDKMMGFKYEKQKRKVTVKQHILSELQEENKKLN